jgi:hypothetical protein
VKYVGLRRSSFADGEVAVLLLSIGRKYMPQGLQLPCLRSQQSRHVTSAFEKCCTSEYTQPRKFFIDHPFITLHPSSKRRPRPLPLPEPHNLARLAHPILHPAKHLLRHTLIGRAPRSPLASSSARRSPTRAAKRRPRPRTNVTAPLAGRVLGAHRREHVFAR